MVSQKPSVIVREVWEENLVEEFGLIKEVYNSYPYASMDTEFPGTVFRPNIGKHVYSHHHLTPEDSYLFMKMNVDSLKLIQVGLTLSDAQGNLPDLGTDSCYIWEFNFRDFDIDKHLHNRESIELLKRQGIDFVKNKEKGIESEHFARLLLKSGLVFNSPYLLVLSSGHLFNLSKLTWVTFHSAYDFGFLIKILIQKELPGDLISFMGLVRFYFGMSVYDMKQMMKYCGLYGGLERVAQTLDVDRVAGKSHQAGSDSLLTMQTFMKLKDTYFNGEESRDILYEFTCKLYGLEVVC